MPDTQLIAVVLLLAVAVVFGYFYLKRAQGRSATSSTDVERPAPVVPRADSAPPADTSTDDVIVRRNEGPTDL